MIGLLTLMDLQRRERRMSVHTYTAKNVSNSLFVVGVMLALSFCIPKCNADGQFEIPLEIIDPSCYATVGGGGIQWNGTYFDEWDDPTPGDNGETFASVTSEGLGGVVNDPYWAEGLST